MWHLMGVFVIGYICSSMVMRCKFFTYMWNNVGSICINKYKICMAPFLQAIAIPGVLFDRFLSEVFNIM